jgi:tripartite-type tricarboxylate transporter receptor subunit TctC
MQPLEPAAAGIRLPIVQRRGVAGTFLGLLLACLSMGSSIEAGHAEGYPERTIKIVVPFPAGGPTDVAARLVAQSLSSGLGHNVIVENQAGAGGRIGAKAVATATSDGYTLLLGGTNVNAITGAIYRNLGFDPIKSFAPVAMLYADSLVLAISPRVPADTCQGLVKYAKDNPGKLKYGAPPLYGTNKMSVAVLVLKNSPAKCV